MKRISWGDPERVSALLLGGGAVLAGMLLLGKWIRGAAAGFEFLDEGYNFLVLQNPWKNLGSGLFGYFLHPFYFLAGEDPGFYRLLGLGILLAAGTGLGRAWAAAVGLSKAPWAWAAQAAVVSGALLIFSNGRRTPAYDYLAFVGAVTAWVGYFRILVSGSDKKAPWLILGLGLGLVVAGKWSSAIPFTLIFLLLSRPWASREARKGWGWAGLACFALGGALAWHTGGDAMAGIFRQTQWLSESLGTHGGGLLAYYVPTVINFIYRSLRAFAYGLPFVLLLFWMQKAKPAQQEALRGWAWVLPWMIFGAGVFLGLTKGGASSFSRVGSNVFCEQLWLAAAFLVFGRGGSWKSIRAGAAVLGSLLATPFALGFGTSTALGDYVGHGAVFFQLAGLFVWKAWVDRGFSAPLAAAFLWVATLFNLARANASLDDPYRSEVPEHSQIRWPIPGQGEIRLDAERAEVVKAADQVLRRAGFQPGDPVVAIGNLPGLVYLVGGWSPGTPWYYDTHPKAMEFTKRVLASIPAKVRKSAWLLLRENGSLFGRREEILPYLDRNNTPPLVFGPVVLEGETTRLWLFPPAAKTAFPGSPPAEAGDENP